MKDLSRKWTRRQFSQVLAAASASTLLMRTSSASLAARRHGFAFVGSSATASNEGTVRVYRVKGEDWCETHAIQAASPAHLVMHPAMPVLYVVHDVSEWDHRPRGAVSAYRFDVVTGQLTHAGTQPLSLSATNPRHAIVIAGGAGLLVAAESGGIYNVLPIGGDGTLQPASAIRKEFGLQDRGIAKTAAPRQMVMHPDGSVYAADHGQETITRFAVSLNSITPQHRSRVHAGAGPSQLAIGGSRFAYTLHFEDGSISMHSMTAQGLSPATPVFEPTGADASMQMHPDGNLMAVSSGESLQLLRVMRRTGSLALQDSVRQPRLSQMRFSGDGTQLLGIQTALGEVVVYAIDPGRSDLIAPRVVACAHGASSLLLHSA